MANYSDEPIYHVLNRGVDKRKIFLDDKDYLRFIHDLFEFNDKEPANNVQYNLDKNKSPSSQYNDFVSRYIERRPRKCIVDILAFCLMPNHYHILIRPHSKEALTLFMRKLNIGYAKYFNRRYKRSGALFQGRFKSVLVLEESHFIHLPYYIHLNPLDLISPEWREGRLKNKEKALDFLKQYRWSSHLDYCGKKNFPSVTQREFLLEFFEGTKNYEKAITSWIKELDKDSIKGATLE